MFEGETIIHIKVDYILGSEYMIIGCVDGESYYDDEWDQANCPIDLWSY